MAKHVTVKPLPDGRWAVCDIDRGDVLETHESKTLACRAILPLAEQTPEERAARLPTYSQAERLDASNARDAALLQRFRDGLPLTPADKRKARKLSKLST